MNYLKRTIAFILIFIFASSQIFAAGDIHTEEGLIGYWDFNFPEEEEELFFSDIEEYEVGYTPKGWGFLGTPKAGSVIVSSEKAFSGDRSIKIEALSDTAGIGLRTPKVAVEEGIPYVASAKYFQESTKGGQIYLEFWDDAGTRMKVASVHCSKVGEWDGGTVSHRAPSGAKHATLLVYCAVSATGIFYYDDVKITRSPMVRDVSGNGIHGVLYNNTHWVESRFGNALKFDGVADYVEITYNPELSSLDVISVEAWIYPIPPHQRDQAGGIINNLNGAGKSRILIMSNGQISAELHGWREAVPGSIAPRDTWSHIVYVYDGTHEIIYVNGKPGAPSPYSGKLPAGTRPLIIGWGDTADNYHYKGLIDEVKIYNRALTPEEVARKATEIDPSKWKGLVSYPNPASMGQAVKVACFVEKACDVELIIYNERGSRIKRLKDRAEREGYHEIEWDGKNNHGDTVPAGIYIAVVTAVEDGKPVGLARGLLVRAP